MIFELEKSPKEEKRESSKMNGIYKWFHADVEKNVDFDMLEGLT